MFMNNWVELNLRRKAKDLIVESSFQIVFYIYKATIIIRLFYILLQYYLYIIFIIIDYKY